MITSIVLTGKYALNINSNNKLKLGENTVSIDKDIPFVRYRFESYSENELNYIGATMEKMKYSTHLAEIKLDNSTAATLEWFKNNITNIARFIYLDITDEDVLRGAVTEEISNMLMSVVPYNVDRIMLKDKSTKLDTVTAKKIIDELAKKTGIKKVNFGVCSSPLSFGDWCCLTAVRARELMTIYSSIADVALPTANHQCMNCCGCIRYFVVDKDTEVIADAKAKEKKVKASTSDGEDGETKTKAPKTPKAFSDFRAYDL